MDEDVKEMCSKFCFNTDDGIRRATTAHTRVDISTLRAVSIPMTVLGGLQRDEIIIHYPTKDNVSIPMTVLGGLQHYG